MDETKTEDTLKNAANFFDANDSMEGFEGINTSTMAVPFIRILQKLSPQLNRQKAEYMADAEEGMFFNTLTKAIFADGFNCIVLNFDHVYIEWKPNRGGFVGYHSPENAERIAVDKTFGAWKTKDGNELSENYVYMLVIEGHEHEGPIVLSLSSSAIKVAREWNRLMLTHIMDDGTKARPYYLVWHIGTEYSENDQGSWYKPSIQFVRYVNEKQYKVAKDERVLLPKRTIDYAQIEGPKASITENVDY